MTRYFITIIATSQLVIQVITVGRAIFVLDVGQPRRILLEFSEDYFAGCGPERVHLNDEKHRLPSIVKVISRSFPGVAST